MNNKGLDFSRMNIEKTRKSLGNGGGVVYKEPGYVKKGRVDMNSYTTKERKIIGECVIKGKEYRDAKYLVIRDGGNDTILNEDYYKIIERFRDYKGEDGIKHYMKFNKNLNYYKNWFKYGENPLVLEES